MRSTGWEPGTGRLLLLASGADPAGQTDHVKLSGKSAPWQPHRNDAGPTGTHVKEGGREGERRRPQLPAVWGEGARKEAQ